MNSPVHSWVSAGTAVLALLLVSPGPDAQGPFAQVPQLEASARMQALSSARGCTFCHRDEATLRSLHGSMPLAPSWRGIATRYRGDGDAEERLTRIVMEGADPADRHWKERIEFTSMRGSEGSLTPEEARALVRWILASP